MMGEGMRFGMGPLAGIMAAGTLLILAGCGEAALTDPEARAPARSDATAEQVAEPELVPVQGQETETPRARETVQRDTATIDWTAARNDLAARGLAAEGQAFQIESGASAPPVPVLLPSGLVRPASAERPAYRALSDGYFARYPGPEYDVIISGTNEWFSGGAGGRDTPVGDAVFTRTLTGAQVALNRYGAAYLVEFECRDAEGRAPGDCISEEEALAIARDLQIIGTR